MTERRIKGGRAVRDAEGFTPKERLFVAHYRGAANRNGTEAAALAGYAQGNRAAARSYASELLRKPHIAGLIARLDEERAERLNYGADDVLRDLLALKAEAEVLGGKSAPAMRTRLAVIEKIGDHVDVGAFRRQVGLSSPSGGPIETVDLAKLATLTDDELDHVERAREIMDRLNGRPADSVGDSERERDPGGAGTPA